MCIRDSDYIAREPTIATTNVDETTELREGPATTSFEHESVCLLYTSDAADERSSVDLGGRRIIKKKKLYKQERRACKMKNIRNVNKIEAIRKNRDRRI